jgi:hypothetical protein
MTPKVYLLSLDLLRAAEAAVVDAHVRLRSLGDLLEWDIAACRLDCLDRVIERYPLDEPSRMPSGTVVRDLAQREQAPPGPVFRNDL